MEYSEVIALKPENVSFQEERILKCIMNVSNSVREWFLRFWSPGPNPNWQCYLWSMWVDYPAHSRNGQLISFLSLIFTLLKLIVLITFTSSLIFRVFSTPALWVAVAWMFVGCGVTVWVSLSDSRACCKLLWKKGDLCFLLSFWEVYKVEDPCGALWYLLASREAKALWWVHGFEFIRLSGFLRRFNFFEWEKGDGRF